jgi:hypothetical protein
VGSKPTAKVDAPEEQRAKGAHEEAGGVRGESRKQRRGLVAGGKEQGGEERRQHRVQVEVVPLEDRAKRGREDDALLFRLEIRTGAADRSGSCRHDCSSSEKSYRLVLVPGYS